MKNFTGFGQVLETQQLETLSHWKTLSIQYGMVIAKKIILKIWNKEISPRFETWLKEISSTLYMEKIRYETSGKAKSFKQIWQPFLDYIAVLVGPP